MKLLVARAPLFPRMKHSIHPASILIFTVLAVLLFPYLRADDITKGPADLALHFASPFDGSQQPYRLYLPSSYDGKKAMPMLVALHGTGGDENKYFDHETYQSGIYKIEAEKQGLVILCPLGTDGAGCPTEWRGEAEINVLAAIEDVQQRFRIDSDRIVCTGQSMGGTGTTYLCCRYPDIFAAGIPLASTYGHVSLVANLRDVPMLYTQGAKDWPIYAATGPIPITKEMKRLGYHGELWMIEGAEHNTFALSTPRVVEWTLKQKRVAHPRRILHRAYFPGHGKAWWAQIAGITNPGWYAEIDAHALEGNRIELAVKNASQVVLRPDPTLYDPAQALEISVAGKELFHGLCSPETELILSLENDTWSAATRPRIVPSRTDWKNDIIGTADTPPTWEGEAETTLGNWLNDSMLDISGADIAISTKGHDQFNGKMRGRPIEAGKPVRLMEFISWLRPSDSALAVFTIKGSALLEILEKNLLDGAKEERFLIQPAGFRYRFDRSLPIGSRVIESNIDPERSYRVVCNSSQIRRDDTLHLGDYFGKLDETLLEPNTLSAAWRFALKNGGNIESRLEGRVTVFSH